MQAHVEYGGYRDVDYFLNATWPFARLTASRDSIEIDIIGFRILLIEKDRIVALKKAVGLFASGLYLRFGSEGRDRQIVFWSSAPQKLISAIEERGYDVEGSVRIGPFGAH